MIRRNLFRATLGGLLLPAVTERVRAYSFVGGWQVPRVGVVEYSFVLNGSVWKGTISLPDEFFDSASRILVL